jgi:hypothetical protein
VLQCGVLFILESCAPGIQVKSVVIDFAAGFDIYDKIEAELQGLDIGVLGTSITHWFVYVYVKPCRTARTLRFYSGTVLTNLRTERP